MQDLAPLMFAMPLLIDLVRVCLGKVVVVVVTCINVCGVWV
jgi:hypothetical protein